MLDQAIEVFLTVLTYCAAGVVVGVFATIVAGGITGFKQAKREIEEMNNE